MAKKPDPFLIDEENPEWTDAEFARAKPASEMLPANVLDGLKRKPGQRGPGKKTPKVPVTLRIDAEVLAKLKASGPRWQTRLANLINTAASAKKVEFAAKAGLAKKKAVKRRNDAA